MSAQADNYAEGGMAANSFAFEQLHAFNHVLGLSSTNPILDAPPQFLCYTGRAISGPAGSRVVFNFFPQTARSLVVNFSEALAEMLLTPTKAVIYPVANLIKKARRANARALSRRAVVLGGCVVLTISNLHSSHAAPAKTAPAKTNLSKTTSAKNPVDAPNPSAKVTTARPADAPQSRIVTRSSAKVAPPVASKSKIETKVQWNPQTVAEAPTGSTPGETQSTPEADERSESAASPRIANANPAPATGNTPAAAPPDENDQRLEVPINPDNKDTPETTVVIEAAPGTLPTPGETVITPAPGTLPADTEEPLFSLEDAEGKEIATVSVSGSRVISEGAILLAATSTRPGAAFSPRQAQLDIGKIRALGFFAAVEIQVAPNLENPEKVDVSFIVQENRVVTGFRFENNKEVKVEDLLPVLVSKTGSLLNSNNVNEDVKKIQALYSERGYAALVTDVKQNDDGSVVYSIQEGVISKIELTGLKKTKPSLVRSVIRSKPGDPFNERNIQRDLNNIYDTTFFEDVTYKVADDPATPGALVVTISLKEKRTGSFSIGLGFDSRSKVSGFVGVSENNFKGTGKNVSAQIELGSQRTFNLGFGDRFVGDKNSSYQFNIFSNRIFREPRSIERLLNNNQETDDERQFSYQEERVGLRFNYTIPLNVDRDTSILFGYRNESVKLFLTGNEDDDVIPVDLPADSSGRTSAVSLGFVRDRRDLRTDPSDGGRELFVIEQGLSLLGTSTFTKADLDLRRYFPLIGAKKKGELPRLVLAGRLVVGQSLGQLPAFEQYFIGGTETVRGYDADEQFGDNQIYGNIEFRLRFQRKFQLVAFADAGSAYGGQFSSSRGVDALVGLGVGVRLQTPIGPVRLDVAQGRDGIKTHFGIGTSF